MSRPRRQGRARRDPLGAVFRALGDPTRRALLARLARAPATVTELAAPFALSLPAVSRHIRVLEHARLLRRTVDGRMHYCRLRAAPLRAADEWLRHYQPFWDATLASLARYVER